jgi:TIR domain-containing protein
MAQVFVSYAQKDMVEARRILEALEQAGLSVFRETSLAAGVSWADDVRHQIDIAKCVVVLWSQAAAESQFVKKRAPASTCLPVVVNGPVIGRMRPTLMVSSAAALTQANAMNTPAVNLQHIGLSSQAHPVGAMISHRHGARRAQAPRPTLVFQPGASLSGRLTRSIPPSS